jgi:hypothetical protein
VLRQSNRIWSVAWWKPRLVADCIPWISARNLQHQMIFSRHGDKYKS